MHQPGIRPRFAALGWEPPKSSSADQVGVHTQAFPTQSTPPKPSPYQQWATNRQWVPPPPFFRSEVKMLVCAKSNIFTPILARGGGGAPPPIASLASATYVATPTTR